MVTKIIDKNFKGGLHFNDQTTICKDCIPYLIIYGLKTRYGLSTREISLYHELTTDSWSGNIIEFGEWRELEWYEVEQAKQFLEEKGYLLDEGCDINDTQQSVRQ